MILVSLTQIRKNINSRCSYLRFPVAIKCSRSSGERDVDEFLEEAKSMLETKAHHENIVNLQGLSYSKKKCPVTSIEVFNF